MSDVIWTIITVWVVWKIWSSFSNARKAVFEKHEHHHHYYKEEGTVTIQSPGKKENSSEQNKGEYVDFEEIK
jgi:hypothetical protein